MRFIGPLLTLWACIGLPSCEPLAHGRANTGESKPPKTGKTERGEIHSMRFDEVFMKQQNGEILLIDARHPWFYQQGHIPGAISLTTEGQLDQNLQQRLLELESARKDGKALVVYCNGFGCHDARTVSRAIATAGFDCFVFGGGWKAWKKADLPFESTSQAEDDLSPQPTS